jgi:MutS domain V
MSFTQEGISVRTIPNSVEADYERRLSELRASLASSQRQQFIVLSVLIACAVLLILPLIWIGHALSSAVTAASIPGIVFGLREYVRTRDRSLRLAIRSGFYERGLDRLRGVWETPESTGDEFARERHLYQFDLQILGERSLFSLLCTTRSQAGAERLASYLLDPASTEEARARQEAVRELREETELREKITLLGKYQFQGCNAEALYQWMSTPVLHVHPAISIFLLASGSVTLLLLVLCLAKLLGWIQVWPILVALVLAQSIVSLPLLREVRPRLRTLRTLTHEFSVLQQGVDLLKGQSFTSPKLKHLVQCVHPSHASSRLLRLERLLWSIAQREREFFALPSLLIAAGTQLVLAVERWRVSNQEQLKEWISAWAEFEALNAIACYAWEHPDDVFPEFTSGATVYEMEGLGHPLLPAGRCVRNDLTLNDSARFCIISGSNMAGKSTFLKAVGINAVLAYAGAPVRAARARLSSFTVCASNSISDSLMDGRSKFLAEAERLRAILRQTRAGKPVLFLVDEILSGTNSHDRRIACESIVRALIAGGSFGILSTHDLALTEIASIAALLGLNCCMESDDPGDPLNFDYRLKPGISRRTNALAILEMIGIEVQQLGP